MTENTDVNKELGAVDIVDKIDNNQRASAIDAIHDMLFGKASQACLLYTSPSPRDPIGSRMPSSA